MDARAARGDSTDSTGNDSRYPDGGDPDGAAGGEGTRCGGRVFEGQDRRGHGGEDARGIVIGNHAWDLGDEAVHVLWPIRL